MQLGLVNVSDLLSGLVILVCFLNVRVLKSLISTDKCRSHQSDPLAKAPDLPVGETCKFFFEGGVTIDNPKMVEMVLVHHLIFLPKGPNTSLEGVLGWFLGVKPLLRRYLDP